MSGSTLFANLATFVAGMYAGHVASRHDWDWRILLACAFCGFSGVAMGHYG